MKLQNCHDAMLGQRPEGGMIFEHKQELIFSRQFLSITISTSRVIYNAEGTIKIRQSKIKCAWMMEINIGHKYDLIFYSKRISTKKTTKDSP